MATAWYAVRTRSRHEAAVHRHLQGAEVQSFLPTLTRWSRWKDRRKRLQAPLFPGYCFARFELADRLTVLNRPGVVDIVAVAGIPAPIPQQEVDGVRCLVESTLQYDPCPLLKKGALVEVVHGPLKGLVGRLGRKGTRARLVLSVELINQAVSVEVHAADVRPY